MKLAAPISAGLRRIARILSTRVSSAAHSDETGSAVVEFGLVLLPLLAFTFLIMDVAWVCFAQASLQHAVQAGVRAAISGYVPDTKNTSGGSLYSGQDAYIRSVVQDNAMGFLAGQTGMNQITITYFSPSNLSKGLSGTGSNAGGNVIQVSVSDVKVSCLGPILRDSLATLSLKANSSDVMESSPDGVPPTR